MTNFKIMKILNFLNINFNNSENKFLSLVYECRSNVAILDKFDANGVFIFSLKKHDFASRVFILMLVWFFHFIKQYLRATYSIDIKAKDFNYVILKVLENKLLDIFKDYVQMVNKPTHISGSLIDVSLKKSFVEECLFNATVENIYFSDHDAVRTIIEKSPVDFRSIP